MTVGAVVPAYDEAGYVGDVIDGLPSFVDRAYVIDDGSTDDTWAEIRDRAAVRNAGHEGRFDRLVVPIRHDENRGVGGAIKTGYLRAREEGIDATAVLGGDDQMDPAELTRYLDPIADGVAGYAKGNRFADPDHWVDMPRFRLAGNVALSYLTKVVSGYWGSMDSQNGYTAISLSALERTDVEGMYEYYGYCNDLLARLNAADVRVADVARSSEYAYGDDWKSHIDYGEYVPRVSLMLFRSFLWRLRRKYLLTDYHPLAPLYLLGIAGVASSLLGLLASLVPGRSDRTGPWVLSTMVGALTFCYATMLDYADNEDLAVQVDPESAPESREGEPAEGPRGPEAAAAVRDGHSEAGGDPLARSGDGDRRERPAEEVPAGEQ